MPDAEAIKLAQLIVSLRKGTRYCSRCADIDEAFDDDEHQKQYAELIKLAESILERAAHAPN